MFDIIVIGGGPSGMTCALYALRSGKSVLIIEKENFGGQIANSPRVENFPSIKEISGLDFSNNLFSQISDLGVNFELDDISSIEKIAERHFKVNGKYSSYEAQAVVIATGVIHRKLNICNEDQLIGHGISYCATCDGAFYKGQDVVVIGDANSALQYSLLLSNICHSVTICTLFDHFFAEEILVNKIKKTPNIKYYHNLSCKEFDAASGELSGVKFINTKTNELVEFKVPAVFVAIGQIPDNEKFTNLVDLKNGFCLVNEKMETKTSGLYAAGDCRLKQVKQLATACNDGAIAAINAVNYIDAK